MGTSIQFMLMERVLLATCGMPSEMLHGQLLPGSTAMYVVGHVFFGVQGREPRASFPPPPSVQTPRA